MGCTDAFWFHWVYVLVYDVVSESALWLFIGVQCSKNEVKTQENLSHRIAVYMRPFQVQIPQYNPRKVRGEQLKPLVVNMENLQPSWVMAFYFTTRTKPPMVCLLQS